MTINENPQHSPKLTETPHIYNQRWSIVEHADNGSAVAPPLQALEGRLSSERLRSGACASEDEGGAARSADLGTDGTARAIRQSRAATPYEVFRP